MSFYTEVIKPSPLFNSVQRISTLDLLEPVTRAAVVAIVADAAAMGKPVQVFETYRSEARQKDLFDRGATQLQCVGTHHFGVAADLVRLVDGKLNWDVSYAFLTTLARKHSLISGIDWGMPGMHNTFVDADHLQRVNLTDQPQLLALKWYPGPTYNPYGKARVRRHQHRRVVTEQ